MSDMCHRALSDNIKILKTTDKNLCSVNRFSADCKSLNHHGKTDGQHKMKRLKSRKERSQMRGGGKEATKSRSYHQYSRRQGSKDTIHLQNCCHSRCHCSSRRDLLFPNVVPAAQEPSIITDSRLIGHHGLFNHEVKSIDIERLLSKQRKLEKSGHQAQEKSNATLHPSSTSHVPSPFCANDLMGANADEMMPYERKSDFAMKRHDESLETEKKVSQGSVTPGQRPQQLLDLSSGSFKSTLSSKHSSLDVVVIKSGKTNAITSQKARESQLTPTVDRRNVKTLNRKIKRHMVSTLERTPKNQASAGRRTQARGLSQSPARLSSSHTADSFDIQQERQDPDRVSKSVSAVAAGLCDSLYFPRLRRRNLVAESRRVLLKALQERHGPRLKENLLEVQQCLNFGADPLEDIYDQEPTMRDEDELWPPDAVTTLFQASAASQMCFDTQKTTSFKVTGSKHFNWKSSPQLHQNLLQTAEWMTSPVEMSRRLLDDIFRPPCSPQFCMDFEPSEVTASDHLFVPPTSSCWGEKASTSQHWENRLNSPKSKEAVTFGSFENNLMNHTRAFTEKRSSVSRYNDSSALSSFPYQAQLDINSQVSHPLTHPPFRSYPTDMIHYPPSHMLERDTVLPLSSFPSPEHWCFPPMRLY